MTRQRRWTIFVGKDRRYSRRFLQMCSHHLVEPIASLGREKGQAEGVPHHSARRLARQRARVEDSYLEARRHDLQPLSCRL